MKKSGAALIAAILILTLFTIPSASAYSLSPYFDISDAESSQSFFKLKFTTSELVDIPYKSKEWFSKEVPVGEKKVTTPGEKGIKKITKEVIFDGSNFFTTTLGEEVIKQPTTEIISVGTTKDYQALTLPDGDTIQYTRALMVYGTSYDHTCKGCNYTTATGRYLTKGIVAVDPRVIKLGTHMYVPGYGFGEAQDTGGKIKGNRIDVAFDDIRFGNWHAQWVTIYLLD